MKYRSHDDRRKDSPFFLYHNARGKVVPFSFFFPQTKQSFEYEGQTQVEFLMTHPVYPAAVAVVIWLSQTVFPAVEATPGICTLWSSRDRLKESDGI